MLKGTRYIIIVSMVRHDRPMQPKELSLTGPRFSFKFSLVGMFLPERGKAGHSLI